MSNETLGPQGELYPTIMLTSIPFTAMSERINHNADGKFGGACVIVPPSGAAPISIFMLDEQMDEGQFWATVLTRIKIAMEDHDAKQKMNRGVYGR